MVKAVGVDLVFNSESDVREPQEWGGSSESFLRNYSWEGGTQDCDGDGDQWSDLGFVLKAETTVLAVSLRVLVKEQTAVFRIWPSWMAQWSLTFQDIQTEQLLADDRP